MTTAAPPLATEDRTNPKIGREVLPGYEAVRYLGRGGFGEVWEVVGPDGERLAAKLSLITNGPQQDRELAGLQRIRGIEHPHLLRIDRAESHAGYLVILMELADRNLAERYNQCVDDGLVGIPRDELLGYVEQSADCLDLLSYEHGLQHLDIKPENLFLIDDEVRVADFGLVQQTGSRLAQGAIAISPPYAPPEMFDGLVGATADQYSLAVTYQEMLTGVRPYDATDVRGIIMQHLQGKPDLGTLPLSDRPAIGRALRRDPQQRHRSAGEMVSALRQAEAYQLSAALQPTDAAADPARSVRLAPRSDRRRRSVFEMFTTRFWGRSETPEGGLVETGKAANRMPVAPPGEKDRVSMTFVAFLPLEIYAHKLRGFIDALDARIVGCEEQNTTLFFGGKDWLGRQRRGIYLSLDTFSRGDNAGHRVVQATVWASGHWLGGRVLGQRATKLIHYLKAYLMANDLDPKSLYRIEAELKRELAG